jgi:uncharacterized membrane protein YdjX (TVP38/TMEM64 family)
MALSKKQVIWRIVALLLVIGLSVAIFLMPTEQSQKLESYGYAGIFLLSILANATIFLPAPGLLIVFSMGTIFNPIGIALAAGTGAALGELSGYIAGSSGQAVIENSAMYKRMVDWMSRNGNLTVFVLAFLPNPFFDLTGVAAGALRMPVQRFLAWCWFGKIGKMLLVALAGAGFIAIPWITNLFNQ